jgi:hypothetical protein
MLELWQTVKTFAEVTSTTKIIQSKKEGKCRAYSGVITLLHSAN